MLDPGAIYDAMPPEAQDMPRGAFIRKVRQLTDPKRFKEDLGKTIAHKQEMRTRMMLAAAKKRQIDEAVG
jgi:hypothetical protein